MTVIEVYADITCPFTHVGLHRIATERAARGRDDVQLWVHAWPLEIVNGAPFDPVAITGKVHALRTQVAPELFTGYREDTFPTTTLQALALAIDAYELGPEIGERFSFAVRDAVFEHGLDIGEQAVLDRLAQDHGLAPGPRDTAVVLADQAAGVDRGVIGSPHFFMGERSAFCPTLDIQHDDEGELVIALDVTAFEDFMAECFPTG